jgi:hypothetical protein
VEVTTTKDYRFASAMRTLAAQAKPFTTATNYVGQVPHEPQIGESIVIIAGASKPFVLRPCGNEFSLKVVATYMSYKMRGLGVRQVHPETIRIV